MFGKSLRDKQELSLWLRYSMWKSACFLNKEAVSERDALRERVLRQLQELGALRATLEDRRFDSFAQRDATSPDVSASEKGSIASPTMDLTRPELLEPGDCLRLQNVFLNAGDRVLSSLRGVRALRARVARVKARQHARALGLYVQESTDSEGTTAPSYVGLGVGTTLTPNPPVVLAGSGTPGGKEALQNSPLHLCNGDLDRASGVRQRTVDELVSEEEEAELDLSMGGMVDGPLLNGFAGYEGGRQGRTPAPLTIDQEVYHCDMMCDNTAQTDPEFLEGLNSVKHNLALLNQQVCPVPSYILSFSWVNIFIFSAISVTIKICIFSSTSSEKNANSFSPGLFFSKHLLLDWLLAIFWILLIYRTDFLQRNHAWC